MNYRWYFSTAYSTHNHQNQHARRPLRNRLKTFLRDKWFRCAPPQPSWSPIERLHGEYAHGESPLAADELSDPFDGVPLCSSTSSRDMPTTLEVGAVLDVAALAPFGCVTPFAAFSTFSLERLLGRSKSSRVYLAVSRKTGDPYAVKVLERDALSRSGMARARSEIVYHMSLMHAAIIKCYGGFIDARRVYIFLEHAEHGDLHRRILRGPEMHERDVSFAVRAIASALLTCHTAHILHRDVKPKNILITTDGSVKLADFGICAMMGACGVVQGLCGTPGYQAIEQLHDHPIGPPADFYAVGVVMFNMLFKCFPYEPADRNARISRLQFPKTRTLLSPDAKNLMHRLLHPNPRARISGSDVLKHPFITRYDANLK